MRKRSRTPKPRGRRGTSPAASGRARKPSAAVRGSRSPAGSKRGGPVPGAADARGWHAAGMRDAERWLGERAAEVAAPEEAKSAAHRSWSERYYAGKGPLGGGWKSLLVRGQRYAEGFLDRCGYRTPLMPVPLRRTAAAIVCATAPFRGLPRVLQELGALPLRETIVVLYGIPASRLPQDLPQSSVTVVHEPEVSDPDVGRALGANLATSDTLLFVDGAKPAEAGALARFLWECDGRADIALNDVPMRQLLFRERGGVQRLQEFLNASLNRRDLKANSLAALPYALSRRALDTIGPATLCVPAKAHAIAVLSKLRIVSGGVADASPQGANEKSVGPVVAGDHAEAWGAALAMRGDRLKRPDLHRNRSILGEGDIQRYDYGEGLP